MRGASNFEILAWLAVIVVCLGIIYVTSKKPVGTIQVGKPVEASGYDIVSDGTFNGGYQNNIREIFWITHKESGRKFFCVTGCGVTEVIEKRSGKSTTHVEE